MANRLRFQVCDDLPFAAVGEDDSSGENSPVHPDGVDAAGFAAHTEGEDIDQRIMGVAGDAEQIQITPGRGGQQIVVAHGLQPINGRIHGSDTEEIVAGTSGAVAEQLVDNARGASILAPEDAASRHGAAQVVVDRQTHRGRAVFVDDIGANAEDRHPNEGKTVDVRQHAVVGQRGAIIGDDVIASGIQIRGELGQGGAGCAVVTSNETGIATRSGDRGKSHDVLPSIDLIAQRSKAPRPAFVMRVGVFTTIYLLNIFVKIITQTTPLALQIRATAANIADDCIPCVPYSALSPHRMSRNLSNGKPLTMDDLVAYTKHRGFIFPTSEIYGGYAGAYDYGPLGMELLRNIRTLWHTAMVHEREDMYGLDGAILNHPRVWDASGHTEGFTDPLFDCLHCKKRSRADHLIEDTLKVSVLGWSLQQMTDAQREKKIACPFCGSTNLSEARTFNLLVEAYFGVVTPEKVYLRGEACQNIYQNVKNVESSMRAKLPFGIVQIGKAFRNEVTLKNFIFRTREFEQMEMQYMMHPDDSQATYAEWRQTRWQWWLQHAGINPLNMRWRQQRPGELAHYAREAWDIEYLFPFGWKEVEGLHDRTDWDLRRHSEYSGQDLGWKDENGKHFYPYIAESSIGATRFALAVLADAYDVEPLSNGEERTVLHIAPRLAPVKAVVLPLLRKPELEAKALEVKKSLLQLGYVLIDSTAEIGKRYRRADEIGVPAAVTVDFQTLEDGTVTVRDRDSMRQTRVHTDDLLQTLRDTYGL